MDGMGKARTWTIDPFTRSPTKNVNSWQVQNGCPASCVQKRRGAGEESSVKCKETLWNLKMLNVWYIYLHEWSICYGFHVGIYTIHWVFGIWKIGRVKWTFQNIELFFLGGQTDTLTSCRGKQFFRTGGYLVTPTTHVGRFENSHYKRMILGAWTPQVSGQVVLVKVDADF